MVISMNKNLDDIVLDAMAKARRIDCEGSTWWTGSDVCRILGFPLNQNGGFYELQKVRRDHRRALPASIGGRRCPIMLNEAGIRSLAGVVLKQTQKEKDAVDANHVFLRG